MCSIKTVDWYPTIEKSLKITTCSISILNKESQTTLHQPENKLKTNGCTLRLVMKTFLDKTTNYLSVLLWKPHVFLRHTKTNGIIERHNPME